MTRQVLQVDSIIMKTVGSNRSEHCLDDACFKDEEYNDVRTWSGQF